MGCAYTGSAGGPIRTEIPIPIPICADEVVESDKTETDSVKMPNTNPDINLRTESFIFMVFPHPIVLAQNRQPEPHYVPPM